MVERLGLGRGWSKRGSGSCLSEWVPYVLHTLLSGGQGQGGQLLPPIVCVGGGGHAPCSSVWQSWLPLMGSEEDWAGWKEARTLLILNVVTPVPPASWESRKGTGEGLGA